MSQEPLVARLGSSLVGLTARDATARAEHAGLTARVLHPGAVHTMEFVDGRVNLVVDGDGVVTRTFHG